MSDLISRSELLKEIEKYKFGAISNDAEREYIKKTILDFIICQPTAYSVDGVVEELQENASRYTKKYVTPYGNNGYRDIKAISVKKAIEIVKQGSVSNRKDCEYRHDNGNWGNSSVADIGDILGKLAEYKALEEQGLLLRLPVKAGDTVYKPNPITLSEIVEIKIESIFITENKINISGRTAKMKYSFCCSPSDIGKTVFLTQEEAEQKLKEMEVNEDLER